MTERCSDARNVFAFYGSVSRLGSYFLEANTQIRCELRRDVPIVLRIQRQSFRRRKEFRTNVAQLWRAIDQCCAVKVAPHRLVLIARGEGVAATGHICYEFTAGTPRKITHVVTRNLIERTHTERIKLIRSARVVRPKATDACAKLVTIGVINALIQVRIDPRHIESTIERADARRVRLHRVATERLIKRCWCFRNNGVVRQKRLQPKLLARAKAPLRTRTEEIIVTQAF